MPGLSNSPRGRKSVTPGLSDEPYTLAQIAELLNANPSTVRLWVSEGRLQARKEGRRWVVDRDIIDEMVASGTRPRTYTRRDKEPELAARTEADVEVKVQDPGDVLKRPDRRISRTIGSG